MRSYPVNLNIRGKVCLIFGGGKVAERKIRALLLAGGKVKVVSPELSRALAELNKKRKIAYVQAEYKPGGLRGAFLVYAATSNRKVNFRIAREARRLDIWVNVCDSVRESTFILPAVLRKKGLVISVSTNGRSPARTVRVRDRLRELV